jgi:lipid-A-disaccharide synthase
MAPEDIRTWLYPFGFLSSFVFFLRFLVQWWKSERAGRSIVNTSFWILSCIGNGFLALHSFIQLHFPIYLLQSQQILLSWRNLNLMGEKPYSKKHFIIALLSSAFFATLLFAAQPLFFNDPFFGWVRAPASQEVGFWMHGIGCLGISAYSLRFWLQWWEAEQKKTSVLSERFWWISVIGAATSGAYFLLLCDWVNFIGPACALLPYSRNLILVRRERERIARDSHHCDIVIIAGETSGDLLGEKIAKHLLLQTPQMQICGVAGPSMRAQGVRAWFRIESFQVMGIVDVVKRSPFLFYALHTLKRRILKAYPKAVIFIDQPSLSINLAKRLKAQGYTGKLIQVVAPTVWAYRPERADHIASYFDLILPLFRFELEYFQDKLPAIWVGHPAATLIPSNEEVKKTTLSLFPGSRPGEIRRNLPLQLKAASLLTKQFPNLTIAISAACGMKKMISASARKILRERYELVDFADRYHLMERSQAAIAKSGTITLELALFNVPTVCCYRTGAFTRWWARTILKLSPRYFALPNILANQEAFPECIIPPVTPQALSLALQPYIQGEKKLPNDLQQKLRSQIDTKKDPGFEIAQAVDTILGNKK